MKRTTLTLLLISLLSFPALNGVFTTNTAKANPLPDIEPIISIDNPQGMTYYLNTITLAFTVESNWEVYSAFYSLDGQEMKSTGNLSIVSQEVVNPASNLQVTRTTLKGSCVLSNLPEGLHKVTFYMITDHNVSLSKYYEKGEILCSANTTFKISFLTTVSAILVALVFVAIVGSLVFFTKRKR